MSQTEPSTVNNSSVWPALPLDAWRDTYATLHLWTQIVGKIRMALSPHVNHWWQVPLYLTARGLTTSPMPYRGRVIELNFDFVEQALLVLTSDGMTRRLELYPRSMADFYQELMAVLNALDLEVKIWPMPVEIPDPIPFAEDTQHAAYDPEYAQRLLEAWRVLLQVDRVLKQFRARFNGKSSPVHFFWGSFDLAVTRFSGRPAPPHPSGIPFMIEAESHESSSVGFWPGSDALQAPAFYSYAYPEPPGLRAARLRPEAAGWDIAMGTFILLYDDMRSQQQPDQALLEFCQGTYETAADLGKWDWAALEAVASGPPPRTPAEPARRKY
jgi:Family of unknown function (DUF5996)